MRKKQIFSALFALLLLLPVLALAEQFAVVRGGRLNLREYPNASSRSFGTYPTGSWVTIEGSSVQGWWPVKTENGKHGYMAGNYLVLAQQGNSAVVRYANGGYVNLRQGPSLDYPVIVRVTSGTTITIVDERYEWNYVTAYQGGHTYSGYMHDSLIEKSKITASVTTRHGGKVNVRRGPSSSYGSYGSLATGTRVRVLQKGSEWSLISGGGLEGFMANTYLTGMSSSGGSGTQQARVAYVNNPRATQVLNLRDRPSQDGVSIGQYRNGTQVKVVNHGKTWCEVYVGTRHGYMMTKYLSFDGRYTPPSKPQQPESTSRIAYVNNPRATQVLYLRDRPSQDGKAIGQYGNGTQVKVVGYGKTWCEVYVGTRHGYMMTRYLSFDGTYTQPAKPTPRPQTRPTTPPAQPSGSVSAGTAISLTVSAQSGSDRVNVYHDSTLSSLKSSYYSGKQATMLQYGDNVCMILVDGQVGYVSTWNITY